MNPNLCRVALRPRGPFEVFDLTMCFMRERARPLAVLALFTCAPVFILCSLIAWFTDGHWASLVLALALAPVIHAPYTVLAGRLLFSEDTSVRAALMAVFSSAGPLAMAWAIGLMGLGAVSCAGLGLIAQPALLYLPETALLERVGATRGLRRTMRLAGGYLGTAIIGVCARWGLPLWLGLTAEFAGQNVVGWVLQLGGPFGALTSGQVTPFLLAGVVAAQPIYAVFRLLLYVDVRTRMEGWDLQVGLRALGIEEAA
jgi:hypothetical protein